MRKYFPPALIIASISILLPCLPLLQPFSLAQSLTTTRVDNKAAAIYPAPTPKATPPAPAQTPSPTPPPMPSPTQFDYYSKIARDDEKARLDNFAISSQNDPGAQGYIIAYGGRRSTLNEAQRRAAFAKEYLVNARGIDADRLVAVDGGYREEATTELYLVPSGAPPPAASPTLNDDEVQNTRPPINANVSTLPSPVPANANVGRPRRLSSGVDKFYDEQQEIEKNKRAIIDNLQTGRLVVDRPNKNWMVGVQEQILARIASNPNVDIIRGLKPESRELVREISVAVTMCVSLETPDKAAFDIKPLNKDECQTIGETSFTPWHWSVKPLKDGQHQLICQVHVKIPVPNQEPEEHLIDVHHESITVQVNPNIASPTPPATPTPSPGALGKLVDKLIEDWATVVAVIIVPLLGWLGWVLKKYILGENTAKDDQ